MTYQAEVLQIDSDTVLAECGPMRLMIRARRDGLACMDLSEKAGHEALAYLERVAGEHRHLCRPFAAVVGHIHDGLSIRMLESVRRVGDADLTPMASVAGTIADAVADLAFNGGATRVIVENGGDIAVRLADRETVEVGVRASVLSRELTHRLYLDNRQPGWGVATSGLGGRSLTRGIASAVTVLASNASVADAAATAVANACYIADPGIIQMPAEQLDPSTDLAGILVTVAVGELPLSVRQAAVRRALDRAEQLSTEGVIIGALVTVDDSIGISKGLDPYVQELSDSAVK